MRLKESYRRWLRIGVAIVLLIICSVLTPRCLARGNIDFPCQYYGSPVAVGSDTRIVYCISWYPANASGGGIVAKGASENDRVIVRIFGQDSVVERQGDMLIFDGHAIGPGETFQGTIPAPSFISSLQMPAGFTITNMDLKGARYALGDVKGGWFDWEKWRTNRD